MLYRFVVENYCSFRERNELSFIPNGSEPQEHVAVCDDGINVLKTAVIYGANASGKTKFIQAIRFARDIVLKHRNIRTESNQAFLLDEESRLKPSMFMFEMKVGGKLYRYAFLLSFHKGEILEEILEVWHGDSGDGAFQLIFSRESVGTDAVINDKYVEGDPEKFKMLGREAMAYGDMLGLTLLSASQSFSKTQLGETAKEIINWFEDMVILFPSSTFNLLGIVNQGIEVANNLYEYYFKRFGLDVKSLKLQPVDIDSIPVPGEVLNSIRRDLLAAEGKANMAQLRGRRSDYMLKLNDNKELEAFTIRFVHDVNGHEELFRKEDESDGTMRLFDFIPMFGLLKNKNRVVLIDEIDRSLHTQMTRFLFEEFFDNVDSSSQLVVTTHDVMLLSQHVLTSSEVWIVNKENEVSKIYPLDKFDTSKLSGGMDVNYLLGRFGGVPQF